MNKILFAISVILSHLFKNLSNYLLFLGISLVLYYTYVEYGFYSCLLSVGIISILASIVIELNKLNNKPQRKY